MFPNKLNLRLNYSSERWDMGTMDIDFGRLELAVQLVVLGLVDELVRNSSFVVQRRPMELVAVESAEYMPIRIVVDSFRMDSPE